MDAATLGALVGAYMLPGAVVALPGGLFGQLFGESRVAVAGLALMVLGGALVAFAGGPQGMGIGRIVSGAGAVLLNVCLTSMLTAWFLGREIVLALGVLASSWSMGIGLSFLILPAVAAAVSPDAALALPALVSGLALLLLAVGYRQPPAAAVTPSDTGFRLNLSRQEWASAVVSGAIWGLFNAAFAAVLVFAPAMLAARGLGIASAAATVSLVNWSIILTLPLGGAMARLAGSATLVMVLSFATLAALAGGLAAGLDPVLACATFGLAAGPVAGLIMALPARALEARNRSAGMGVFFAVYNVCVAAFIPAAGWLRDRSGETTTPLWVSAIAMLACIGLLAVFERLQRARSR
jgi:MFS family permease